MQVNHFYFSGDADDFQAVDRYVEDIVNSKRLASQVSVHNISPVTAHTSDTIVFNIWSTPKKGYNASALFEVLREHKKLYHRRNPPIMCIGVSTDSAGFQLSLGKFLMSPQQQLVNQGIVYLGLGIPEEKYLSPMFNRFCHIHYPDFDHSQRSALRQLKYPTLDMFMFKDSNDCMLVTIDHIIQLRQICIQKNIQCTLSDKDLVQVKFLDQNSDAAYKVFSPRTAELLDQYVPGSIATSLYITMIHSLREPYSNPHFGSPLEVVKSVATGLTMLRLWRRYLLLEKARLTSQRGAKSDRTRRGNFITTQTYETLELQCHAAILHQMALFLYARENGHQFASPKNASTVATERFIGQSQAKTSHVQSLNQEPSVAETIDRANAIQFNLVTLKKVAELGIKVQPTTNRKKIVSSLSSAPTTARKQTHYSYPATFQEFQQQLTAAFYDGVKMGQAEMERLPIGFMQSLMKNDYWNVPFTFSHACQLMEEIPCYDKLDVTIHFEK